MRDWLNDLDTRLFLWLNGQNAPWLDGPMVWITNRNSWIPFYVALVAWLAWRYRRAAVGYVLTLAGAVLLSDQFTSSVLKPLTLRLRPCHEPALQALIHPVLECGGRYGFCSSHAANSMALAVALWLLLPDQRRWTWVLFPWAALLGYSRIYVGAHYPLDVLAGAGIGAAVAFGCVALWRRIAGTNFR